MAQPEAVADEAAAAPLALPVAREPLTYRSRFNLRQLFKLYDVGGSLLPRSERLRWLDSFALAASTEGVWSAERGGNIAGLAAFWRTKNPHVNLRREIPEPDLEGNYVYVCWMWSFDEVALAEQLRAHIIRTIPEAEFIAWHDHRTSVKRKRRGRLWVLKVGDADVANLLAARNGSH